MGSYLNLFNRPQSPNQTLRAALCLVFKRPATKLNIHTMSLYARVFDNLRSINKSGVFAASELWQAS